MPTLFTPGLRRLLWAALSAWSQDASPEAKPGTYRADVRTPLHRDAARSGESSPLIHECLLCCLSGLCVEGWSLAYVCEWVGVRRLPHRSTCWPSRQPPESLLGTQVRRGIIAAKVRLKDPDMQRSLEGDLVDSVELLEHSANLALAALFMVRSAPYGTLIAQLIDMCFGACTDLALLRGAANQMLQKRSDGNVARR